MRVCMLTLYMASMVEKFSRDLSSKRNVCSRAVMTSLTLWKHRIWLIALQQYRASSEMSGIMWKQVKCI